MFGRFWFHIEYFFLIISEIEVVKWEFLVERNV